MTDYNDVPVEDDSIKLGQFLKLANLIDSGGEAKRVLAGILRDLAADGHAVLVATHDVEFVAQAADDVVVLAEGEVVSSGPVRRWPISTCSGFLSSHFVIVSSSGGRVAEKNRVWRSFGSRSTIRRT